MQQPTHRGSCSPRLLRQLLSLADSRTHPATRAPNCAGMMAEAYFVFSVGNLKGIWTQQYPE